LADFIFLIGDADINVKENILDLGNRDGGLPLLPKGGIFLVEQVIDN
jgi:hypothetical protein